MGHRPIPQPELPPTEHFSFRLDFEGIGWLTIDVKDSSVNILSQAVMTELETLVGRIASLAAAGKLAGVVLLSGKKTGFIAGADVHEFEGLTDPSVLAPALTRTHRLFERIETLGVPFVAGISGFCLGGGLELALACHYRIAVDDDRTRLGFPEVRLGIFPGFGGTGRSIRQAGPADAMAMMLTGRALRAKAARAINLIDRLVSYPDQLAWAGRKAVLGGRRSRPASFFKSVLGKPLIRDMLVRRMRQETAKKARPEHYPAPHALIDLFAERGADWRAMMQGEIERFPALLAGPVSANLRRVFFLSEGLKKQGLKGEKPRFARVHVIGAGVMGGDIAAWCAYRGLDVTLQDLDAARIVPALKRARALFAKRLKSKIAIDAAMSRLRADVDGLCLQRADVVVEAVVERLDVKQAIFARAEQEAGPGAILATNTSSIALEKIAEGMVDRTRLIGLHFFNPVAQLPLVEVIRSAFNADAAVARGASFALAISKSPVVVKSAPGFLVNRVLMPYMMGAVDRVEHGESKELIDAAAVAFGMPMGPIELLDTVGLDVGKSVAEELGHQVPRGSAFETLVAADKLGRKRGEGFYRWHKGKAKKGPVPEHADLAGLGQALVAPLVEACALAVEEGVVDSADLADIGVILGTGFAPFLGGPLKAREDGKV